MQARQPSARPAAPPRRAPPRRPQPRPRYYRQPPSDGLEIKVIAIIVIIAVSTFFLFLLWDGLFGPSEPEPTCTPFGDENNFQNCHDTIDNDCDGYVDCADNDCQIALGCAPEQGHCFDNLDNDIDGYIDCEDRDCNVECQGLDPETSIRCGDGFDNDKDTYYDCCDPQCKDYVTCQTEFICDDQKDYDCDLAIDCADPDCINSIACGGDCGDGIINPGEDCDTCPQDMETVTGESCCGNGELNEGENCNTCKVDFETIYGPGKCCGNGELNPGENCDTCPEDYEAQYPDACATLPGGEALGCARDTPCHTWEVTTGTLLDIKIMFGCCHNGIDDDGDGLVDCCDYDCAPYCEYTPIYAKDGGVNPDWGVEGKDECCNSINDDGGACEDPLAQPYQLDGLDCDCCRTDCAGPGGVPDGVPDWYSDPGHCMNDQFTQFQTICGSAMCPYP